MNFFKKLFSKKLNSYKGLIRIEDLNLPSRHDLKDLTSIEELEEIKKEYQLIIHSRKDMNRKNLGIINIQKEMILYNDLLSKLITEQDTEIKIDFIHYQDPEWEQVNKKQKAIKLLLYKNIILELERKATIHLIALLEINEEIKFFPHKRKVLSEEINHFISSYFVYQNQVKAILIEIDTYTKVQGQDTIYKDRINQFLNQKKKNTYQLLNWLNHNLAQSIIEKDLSIEGQIAFLEYELELYVYNHQEEILLLKEELQELKDNIFKGTNYYQLLNHIKILETKYILFANFGHHLISEEDIDELYRVKFSILTLNISDFNAYIAKEEANYSEMECYYRYVFEKIECILKGNNTHIRNLFGEEEVKAIQLIKKILSNENGYQIESILKSPKLLSLLLACDKENGIIDFFQKYEEDLNTHQISYNSSSIELNCKVPLATIYWLESIDKQSRKYPLFQLYQLIEAKMLEGEIYYIPEGIVRLEGLGSPEIDDIRLKAKNKTVVFPSSLKRIAHVFESISLKAVILNDGLEEIENYTFYETGFQKIVIPSTVKSIGPIAFSPSELKIIEFNDYTNSYLLNHMDELDNFLLDFYESEETGKEGYYPSEHGVDIYDVFFAQASFKKMIFRSENNFWFLTGEDLKFTYEEKPIWNMLNSYSDYKPITPAHKLVLEIQKRIGIVEKNLESRLNLKK